MRRGKHRIYTPSREAHVIQYLTRYGPKSMDELMIAVPGDIGGRADRVARRLIREGRLDENLICESQDA